MNLDDEKPKKSLYLEKIKNFIYNSNNKFYKETGNLISSFYFYNNNKISNYKENDICSICLNKIKYKTGINSCNHYFCFTCIYKWTNEKNKCPLCRKNYNKFRKFF